MEPIPVCKPLLPVAEKLRPYLERIDAKRYYSNQGALLSEFEVGLARHFGVSADEIATSANGTLAMIQTLKAMDARSGSLCVMPSWTFTATPAAALSAGLVPYFVDVHGTDWAIHPEDVLTVLKTQDVGAVIPVAPFGAPLNVAEWEEFRASTGIPVIIDAAAGFDSFSAERAAARSSIPVMVSLHATKVFGIGEGAVVVTRDVALAKRIRMYGNFGFYGTREAMLPGINAKLTEYAAAIGLAALDEWPEKRKVWQQLSNRFEALVKRNPKLACAAGFNQGWVSCYGLVEITSGQAADQIKAALAPEIGTVMWWGGGCHVQTAYRDCPRAPMDTTEALGKRVLGLPFWLGLEESQLFAVFGRLEKVLADAQQGGSFPGGKSDPLTFSPQKLSLVLQ